MPLYLLSGPPSKRKSVAKGESAKFGIPIGEWKGNDALEYVKQFTKHDFNFYHVTLLFQPLGFAPSKARSSQKVFSFFSHTGCTSKYLGYRSQPSYFAKKFTQSPKGPRMEVVATCQHKNGGNTKYFGIRASIELGRTAGSNVNCLHCNPLKRANVAFNFLEAVTEGDVEFDRLTDDERQGLVCKKFRAKIYFDHEDLTTDYL